MKKFTLLITLFSALSLFGCANEGTLQEEFIDEPQVTQISGILTEQKTDDNFKGTHLLTMEDESLQPVMSVSLNLSSDKYLGNEVKLMGIYNNDNVFEVTGVQVLNKLSEASKDEARTLTAFKDTDLGFQFKFFNDWIETVEDGTAAFTKTSEETGEEAVVTITQEPFEYSPVTDEDGNTDTPLLSYLSQNYPDISDPDAYIHKIGMDNLNALKFEFDDNIDYFLYRNGLIYHISFTSTSKENADAKNDFNTMITEFRFTGFTTDAEITEDDTAPEDEPIEEDENNDIEDNGDIDLSSVDANFSTFESLPFSFSADYPANWYYAGTNPSDPDVLWHYGFSDEPVTDENEFASLNIIRGDAPAGTNMDVNGQSVIYNENNGVVNVYAVIDGKTFHLQGNSDNKELLLLMAGSISTVERDEE